MSAWTEMLMPQPSAKVADGGRDRSVRGTHDDIDVEIANVAKKSPPDSPAEIIAVRVQRYAVEIRAADSRPAIVHRDDLAVDEDLVQQAHPRTSGIGRRAQSVKNPTRG